MTRLDEVTGSPDRSTAVLAMVAEAIGEGDASLENAASKTGRYNNFGDLYDDEFQIALAMLQPAEFNPADVQVENSPPRSSVDEQSSDANTVGELVAAGKPTMTRDEANAELQRRTEALMAARAARMVAEDARNVAVVAMEKLRSVWQAGGPTKDQIRRNEIAAINRDRGLKVERGNPRVLRSAIDREAAYSTGGDATTYVKRQHRFGSFHRAALGDDGLLHRPGRKGTKLPSEL
jgi:hypothetical protein